MLGLAQGCLNCTVPYLHERKQFGQKVWDFQVRITSCHNVYQSYSLSSCFPPLAVNLGPRSRLSHQIETWNNVVENNIVFFCKDH